MFLALIVQYLFLPLTVTEKNATKNILDGRTEVKQYTPLPLRGAGVYKFRKNAGILYNYNILLQFSFKYIELQNSCRSI
jgi:hypothetical protein